MAELRTEEEQIKAFKEWWKKNAKILLLSLSLIAVISFSWQGWKSYQQSQSEQAAILYQQMLEAVVSGLGAEGDYEQLVSADNLADELKDNHSNSIYAKLAVLVQARLAVDQKDYDRSLAALNWVLKNQPARQMKIITNLRKARLLSIQGEYDKALSLLDSLEAGEFKANIEELKGDLLLKKKDEQAAREAYQEAQDAAQSEIRPLLNSKLNDLTVEEK